MVETAIIATAIGSGLIVAKSASSSLPLVAVLVFEWAAIMAGLYAGAPFGKEILGAALGLVVGNVCMIVGILSK